MRNDLLFILLVTQFNWNFFFFFFFKGWGDPGKEPYCTELKQNRDFNIGSAYRAKVYIIFFSACNWKRMKSWILFCTFYFQIAFNLKEKIQLIQSSIQSGY